MFLIIFLLILILIHIKKYTFFYTHPLFVNKFFVYDVLSSTLLIIENNINILL